MKNINTKILIIGSGPAGYTAAIYAARANLNPHLVVGLEPGGQLNITTDVENYPGYENIIQGPWLMEQMKIQAQKVGTVIHDDMISKIDLSKKPFKAIGENQTNYITDTVIISTGAQVKWLNIESEKNIKDMEFQPVQHAMGFFLKIKKLL